MFFYKSVDFYPVLIYNENAIINNVISPIDIYFLFSFITPKNE